MSKSATVGSGTSRTGLFVGLGAFILACCFAKCACGVTKLCFNSVAYPEAMQTAEQNPKSANSYRACVEVLP